LFFFKLMKNVIVPFFLYTIKWRKSFNIFSL